MAHGGRRAHLALINPAISALRVPDLERPIFRHGVMDAHETLVGSVSKPTHCQQMQVPVPYPRDLEAKIQFEC